MSVKIERYPDKLKGSLNFITLESVSLDYDISWESIPVYGRQDAIQTYKTTGQTISMTVAKTFKKAKQFKTLISNLNKFSRPVYEDGVIVRSPLWKVTLLGGNGYVETPLVIAPTSVSVDYGDRLRKIESLRFDAGASVNTRNKNIAAVFGKIKSIPKRVSISISGVVINTEESYLSFSTALDPSGPIVEPGTPQAKGTTGAILRAVRTEGKSKGSK